MDSRALNRFMKTCGAAALLAWASSARAQSAPEDTTPPPTPGPTEQAPAGTLPACPPQATTDVTPTPPPPPMTQTEPAPAPVPVATHERRHNRVFAPMEVSLTTGAGATNYFGASDRADTVDAGAAWDARLMFGAHSAIALEAAYMGAVNNVDLGSGVHGSLHSNGFDGDVRFQLPTRVQPYVFGGVGYNHMEVRNNGTGAAGIYVGKDDQVTIPAGGGLTAYVGHHFNVDARGTYRFIPDNGITQMGTGHLHQWIAQAHLGYAF